MVLSTYYSLPFSEKLKGGIYQTINNMFIVNIKKVFTFSILNVLNIKPNEISKGLSMNYFFLQY